MRWLTAAVLFAFGCSGVEDDALRERKRCEKVRDHLVALNLEDANTAHPEKHRRAMRNALGDAFISACTATMSSAESHCILKAATSSSAQLCTRSNH